MPLQLPCDLARELVKRQEAKDLADSINQLSLNREETGNIINSAMRGYASELHSAQKLWKKGSNPALIKAGLALIAFPDPIVTDIIGSAMVVAGLIQLKMRNSAVHIEDLYKTFPEILKELGSIKQHVT